MFRCRSKILFIASERIGLSRPRHMKWPRLVIGEWVRARITTRVGILIVPGVDPSRYHIADGLSDGVR